MLRFALTLCLMWTSVSAFLGAQCGFFIPGQGVPASLPASFSPYCISADPSCGTDCITFGSLTIQPGVTIRVDPGVTIIVTGALQAVGTPGAPIIFTERVAGAGWGGLIIQGSGSVLEHCIVEHARNSGIRIVGAGVTMVNVTIRNCSTPGQGGGLHIDQQGFIGTVTLQGCTIANNTSSGHGGGIRAILGDSTFSLISTVVQGNAANPENNLGSYVGGGVYLTIGPQGLADMAHCKVIDNIVRSRCSQVSPYPCLTVARGGGVFLDGSGSLYIRHTNLSSNGAHAHSGGGITSQAAGGGLDVSGGVSSVRNAVIAGNWTAAGTRWGAGLYVTNGGVVYVVNSSIANNGGSPGQGSHGIYLNNGSVSLLNSIVWGNNPGSASLTDAQISPANSSSITVSHSCVQGTLQPSWTACINSNPAFKEAFGTTAWQLAIGPTSPCVDAGDPATSDACFGPNSLPGLGTALADMGHFGGDENCGWYPWTTPGSSLVLNAPANPPSPGQPFWFTVTGVPPAAGQTATAVVGLSCSGTVWGIPTGDGRTIPLVLDPCTLQGISFPLVHFFTANVNPVGTASTAPLAWPLLPPGITFFFAAVVVDSLGAITTITAPIRITT